MTSIPNATRNTEDFEFQALNEARNYRNALLREFGPFLKGNVLEVGAGVGQLTEELRRLGPVQKLCAVEPDEVFCERIRAKFPDQQVVHGTIENLEERQGWSSIISVNVLEHIEEDEAELKSYRQLLADKGGWLCLFVPARPEIYAPIDRDFGHFRRYTRGALRSRLEAAGFSVDRLRYYNFAGYFAWWLNFCVLKKRGFERNAVRFFDRAIFPLVNWSETSISAPPIGQSLLAIARANR
ncbi:class I SAM-dependent methyltransferase [Occallatibacter savannae]|uniref:class I SAM-dependent methyltransferase n=1 Tax=Occallatibacter savannae TaxID=1002691 RepID=UPI000D696F5A|nr:class I SAM-dependent methyltransferase [Occallatibacter savannae]